MFFFFLKPNNQWNHYYIYIYISTSVNVITLPQIYIIFWLLLHMNNRQKLGFWYGMFNCHKNLETLFYIGNVQKRYSRTFKCIPFYHISQNGSSCCTRVDPVIHVVFKMRIFVASPWSVLSATFSFQIFYFYVKFKFR